MLLASSNSPFLAVEPLSSAFGVQAVSKTAATATATHFQLDFLFFISFLLLLNCPFSQADHKQQTDAFLSAVSSSIHNTF